MSLEKGGVPLKLTSFDLLQNKIISLASLFTTKSH